ncbi:hypothetical protein B0H21DRAFT_818012 [Amylocystis lapponica]|nr:hypothetical protein B0H21DRAFT_818012 [Amylocystis lapponica]
MSSADAGSGELRYNKLNGYVLLFDPVAAPENAKATDPSVILVFGWLNGQIKHLLKYVEPLRAAYPASTIILVKADMTWYWTSQTQLEASLAPIADVLRREMAGSTPFRGVLVHVFSNGGGFQLMTLRKVLAKLPPPDAPTTAPTALILDSVPGDGGLTSTIDAIGPKGLLGYLMFPAICAAYGVFVAANALGGHPPIFDELRSTLNEPVLLPSISGPETPRLYLYSSADKTVHARWVEVHIAEAQAKGFDVAVEKFTSPHVAHARSDPERYWGAVKSVWEKAVSGSAGASS